MCRTGKAMLIRAGGAGIPERVVFRQPDGEAVFYPCPRNDSASPVERRALARLETAPRRRASKAPVSGNLVVSDGYLPGALAFIIALYPA